MREFPERDPNVFDLLSLGGLTERRYTVTNPVLDLGVTIEFDETLFEYIWYGRLRRSRGLTVLWRNYNIGLEPSTAISTIGGQEAAKENDAANRVVAAETFETQVTLATHPAGQSRRGRLLDSEIRDTLDRFG